MRQQSKRRARNDLEIALDGNAQRVEAQLADQLGDADAFNDPAMLAVDADLDCVIDRHFLDAQIGTTGLQRN